MTLAELKQKNSDIISGVPSWDDLKMLANGAALFYVSMPNGYRPKDERRVLWAGHVLTGGMSGNELYVIRTTSHGNPRIDTVTKDDLGPAGRAALFLTDPIPEYDSRNMEPWNHWD